MFPKLKALVGLGNSELSFQYSAKNELIFASMHGSICKSKNPSHRFWV